MVVQVTAATFMFLLVMDPRQLRSPREGPPFGYTSLKVVEWTAWPCKASGLKAIGAKSPDLTPNAPHPTSQHTQGKTCPWPFTVLLNLLWQWRKTVPVCGMRPVKSYYMKMVLVVDYARTVNFAYLMTLLKQPVEAIPWHSFPPGRQRWALLGRCRR